MPLRPVELTVNRRRVPVREATGVVAVRTPGAPPADPAALVPGASAADLARFAAAGWAFVRRADLPAGVAPAARVLVRPDGRVSLGTYRLTVKLKDPAAPAAVFAALRPAAVTPLGFAPGLYAVVLDPAAGRDAVDAAAELARGGGVEYAEPELVEPLGGRG